MPIVQIRMPIMQTMPIVHVSQCLVCIGCTIGIVAHLALWMALCDVILCKYKINSKAYFNDHNKRMHKAQRGLLMCIMQRKSKVFYKSPANDKASEDTWKFSWLQQILWSKTKYEEAYEKCPQGKKWNEGTQMDHTRTKIWMTIQLTMYYLT